METYKIIIYFKNSNAYNSIGGISEQGIIKFSKFYSSFLDMILNKEFIFTTKNNVMHIRHKNILFYKVEIE